MRNPLLCNGYHYTSRTPKVIAGTVLLLGLGAGWMLWQLAGARAGDLVPSLATGVVALSLPGLLFGVALASLMKREPCTRCSPSGTASEPGWVDERHMGE